MDTQKIDWTQGLEAANRETGAVVPVSLRKDWPQPDQEGDYRTTIEPAQDANEWWDRNGKSRCSDNWYLRNVAPKEVEWGPEIKVEGKRPEWLTNSDLRIDVSWGKTRYTSGDNPEGAPVSCVFWEGATAIRLPANHPHYTKPATPARTALEQRMEGALRKLASEDIRSHQSDGVQAAIFEARAIVAELPEPADPDEIEADAIMTTIGFRNVDPSSDIRKVALAALRRGRALERGE